MTNTKISYVVGSELDEIKNRTQRDLSLRYTQSGCCLFDEKLQTDYMRIHRVTSGKLEIILPLSRFLSNSMEVDNLKELKKFLRNKFSPEKSKLVYSDSKYFRGHDDITNEGILLELGKIYLREDGYLYQVMSVEVLGDCNILVRCVETGDLSTLHAGLIFENKFVCETTYLQSRINSREKELRKIAIDEVLNELK
jgi:hypothetical protein